MARATTSSPASPSRRIRRRRRIQLPGSQAPSSTNSATRCSRSAPSRGSGSCSSRRPLGFRHPHGTAHACGSPIGTDLMYRAFFGCGNPFPNTPSISAGILGGTKPVLLAGAVGEDVTRLQLRFEDGDTIELPAVDGYVLGELPTRHYPPGARLTLAIARDATGAEVGEKELRDDSARHVPMRAGGRDRSRAGRDHLPIENGRLWGRPFSGSCDVTDSERGAP